MKKAFFFFLIIFCFIGCQTASVKNNKTSIINRSDEETAEDVSTALLSVAEALKGDVVDDEELRKIASDVRNDEQAKSAIESITNSKDGQVLRFKYSPATGKRYASHLEICPDTGVRLEWVED
ncbi:MAG: hypothetical protein P9X22_04320 [Candidatus Zapsychrus exili]|nr:hypothetical protein [Candidatus Zapsychrus exili]